MMRADLAPRVVALESSADLLALAEPGGFFFERDGQGVVGNGVAMRIEIPPGPNQIERAAQSADAVLRELGEDAIVVGALPFDWRNDGSLIVPEVAISRRNGVAKAVLMAGSDVPAPTWPVEQTNAFIQRISDDPGRYVQAVGAALDAIAQGRVSKVVLARTMRLIAQEPIDLRMLVRRLRDADRHAFAFSTGGPNPMAGASPELLVSREGDVVRSMPLAGSARRSNDATEDAAIARGLLASSKDRTEHEYVVRAVRDALDRACASVQSNAAPTLLATSKVWHLATQITGTVKEPVESVLQLAARLHPTPAVCGTPRQGARELIERLEPFNRGLYAGIVGWMDARGDGEWAITLRCAALRGNEALLYAGSGIVQGSDPEQELAETEAKFEVLLQALS